MAFDTPTNRKSLIDIFPDLAKDSNFKILSDCSYTYNCIAWAMGYDDRWVDVSTAPGHWWPSGVVKNLTPKALIAAFEAEGFELSDNCMPETGYSKVVLYKKADSEEWTHAARIITADIEYSKFGTAWDGQHSHNVLCNTSSGQEHQSYGVAYAYMKRGNTAEHRKCVTGKMTVNIDNLNKLIAQLGDILTSKV